MLKYFIDRLQLYFWINKRRWAYVKFETESKSESRIALMDQQKMWWQQMLKKWKLWLWVIQVFIDLCWIFPLYELLYKHHIKRVHGYPEVATALNKFWENSECKYYSYFRGWKNVISASDMPPRTHK